MSDCPIFSHYTFSLIALAVNHYGLKPERNLTSIGFGTWSWGNQLLWGYQANRDDSILKQTFLEAVQGGLHLIDTADSYGSGKFNGRSEYLLGQFVQEIPNNKAKRLTIATKLAPFPWRIGRNGFRKAFLSSQKRLKGNIKRVQLHWSTFRYAPWQESPLLDCMADLVEEGFVQELGVSNVGPVRLKWMQKHLAKRNIQIKSIQIQFSLLAPNCQIMEELKNTCKEFNIEILAYSPLALGVLTLAPEAKSIKSTPLRNELFRRLLPGSKDLRKGLQDLAKDRKVSQAEIALNWCRAHNTIPIPGIRNPQQAKAVISASKWNLSIKERSYLDNLRDKCNVRMTSNPFISN